jgi:hypothetical protein
MSELQIDFMGKLLCKPCWNTQHFDREKTKEGKPIGFRFTKCLKGGCECDCQRVLYAEAFERGLKHFRDDTSPSSPFRDEARKHFYYSGFRLLSFPRAEELFAAGELFKSAKDAVPA